MIVLWLNYPLWVQLFEFSRYCCFSCIPKNLQALILFILSYYKTKQECIAPFVGGSIFPWLKIVMPTSDTISIAHACFKIQHVWFSSIMIIPLWLSIHYCDDSWVFVRSLSLCNKRWIVVHFKSFCMFYSFIQKVIYSCIFNSCFWVFNIFCVLCSWVMVVYKVSKIFFCMSKFSFESCKFCRSSAFSSTPAFCRFSAFPSTSAFCKSTFSDLLSYLLSPNFLSSHLLSHLLSPNFAFYPHFLNHPLLHFRIPLLQFLTTYLYILPQLTSWASANSCTLSMTSFGIGKGVQLDWWYRLLINCKIEATFLISSGPQCNSSYGKWLHTIAMCLMSLYIWAAF